MKERKEQIKTNGDDEIPREVLSAARTIVRNQMRIDLLNAEIDKIAAENFLLQRWLDTLGYRVLSVFGEWHIYKREKSGTWQSVKKVELEAGVSHEE